MGQTLQHQFSLNSIGAQFDVDSFEVMNSLCTNIHVCLSQINM